MTEFVHALESLLQMPQPDTRQAPRSRSTASGQPISEQLTFAGEPPQNTAVRSEPRRRGIPGWGIALLGISGFLFVAVLAAIGLIASGIIQLPSIEAASNNQITASTQASAINTSTAESANPTPQSTAIASEPEPTEIAVEPSPSEVTMPETAELTIWHSLIDNELAVLQQLFDAYQVEHPGMRVNLVYVEPSVMAEKYITSLEAGVGPDMVISGTHLLAEIHQGGGTFDLRPYLSPEHLSGYQPVAVTSTQVDGKQVALPLFQYLVLMYYNKQLVPTPPGTTDELMNLTREGISVELNANPYFLYGLAGAFGSPIIDKDNYCFADQDPNYLQMLQYLLDLKHSGAILTNDNGIPDGDFMSGKAAIIFNGPWALPYYQEGLGENLGAAPLPRGSNPATPFVSYMVIIVNPQSRHTDASVQIALHLISQPSAQAMVDSGWFVPANMNVETQNPLMQAFLQQAQNALSHSDDIIWGFYFNYFTTMMQQVLVDESQSPEDGARDACQQMNAANGK